MRDREVDRGRLKWGKRRDSEVERHWQRDIEMSKERRGETVR